MDFRIAPLPYSKRALEPHISELTLDVHYEKHHKGYLEKLAKLLAGKPEEHETLEELIRTAEGEVFENAAQVWNHAFYWKSLRPDGGRPEGELSARIEECFGDFGSLKERLAEAAIGQFGSGWAWLTADEDGRLGVLSTSDCGQPAPGGQDPSPHHRRVGARLLPRSPAPPRALRARGRRSPARLGVRCREPAAARERSDPARCDAG